MSKRKWPKILGISAALLILAVVALIAIPFLFHDEVVASVKKELNSTLDATVDFKDARLGLLRSFPDICLTVEGLTIDGAEHFSGVRLLEAEKIDLEMDLFSLINKEKEPVIKGVRFVEPVLNVIVDAAGRANYDIMQSSESDDASEGGVILNFDKYEISDGALHYHDLAGNTSADLLKINHEGRGRFADDVFDLDTRTDIASLDVISSGVKYMSGVHVHSDALIQVDLNQSRYSFSENTMSFNDLDITLNGSMAMPEEGIDFDLQFTAPSDDIRQFISLIPGVFTQELDQLSTSGIFSLAGMVKGRYQDKPLRYQAFDVKLKMTDGLIKSPDAPFPMEKINAAINLVNTSGNPDDLVVDIPALNLEINNSPFKSNLHIDHPISDPHVVGEIDGSLDLASVAAVIPFENVEELSGLIEADVKFDARHSHLAQEKYDLVSVSGKLTGKDLISKMADRPKVVIPNLAGTFSPQAMHIDRAEIKMGESDLTLEATLDNLLSLIKPGEPLDGKVKLTSSFLDLDELMATSEEASEYSEADTAESDLDYRMDLIADVARAKYGEYLLEDVMISGVYEGENLEVRQFDLVADGNDLKINGNVSNVLDYIAGTGTLKVDGEIKSNKLDLNKWYTEADAESAGADSAAVVYEVPKNIDLTAKLVVGDLQYTDIAMEDFEGELIVRDQALVIEKASTTMLGGRMDFAGSYETLAEEAPAFRMKFDASQFDFGRTFSHIPFLSKLAPIGKHINGVLNSNLVLEGDLLESMYPDLGTLTGSGVLETVNGLLSDFIPMDKVAELLSLNELRKVDLHRSKNWFEVSDGMVEVKPFDFRIDKLDLDMNIAGTQQLDGEMNYKLMVKVPRELLRKNAVTDQVDRGYGLVLERANKMGLRLEDSEYVNLEIDLAGNPLDPSATLRVVDGAGRTADEVLKDAVTEKVTEVTDSARDRASEELENAKDSISQELTAATDSLRKKVNERAEEITEEVKEKIKKEVGSAVDSIVGEKTEAAIDSVLAQAGKEILGDSATATVEDIKKKLEDFNPFKKKKKKKKEGQ